MVTVFDVASGVRIRLGAAYIPTTLSDGSIADLATDRINFLNQTLGVSIASGNFSTNYLQPLRDIVTADVIAIRNNSDIDSEISVGNIRLAYSNKQTANQWQAQYWLDQAQRAIDQLGVKILADYSSKVF